MAFAVVSSGRKQAAFIEVDIKTEAAFAGRELCRERRFVLFVNRPIERAEVFLHLFIKSVQLILQDVTVGVVGGLCGSPCDLRRLVLSHCFPVITETKLRSRQKRLRIESFGLVWLGVHFLSQSLQ